MKITVIGASGLIGTKVVDLLDRRGARSRGRIAIIGSRRADRRRPGRGARGRERLVDLLNSPSFDDDPVMEFFTTSTTNLVAAAKAAGVGHYVALSIVGVDGLPDSGYMRAKVVQEKIITESGLPYTILRATQFAEFTDAHHRLDDRRRRGAGTRRVDPAGRRRSRSQPTSPARPSPSRSTTS